MPLIQKTFKFQGASISYYHNAIDDRETIVMLHPAFADHQIFDHQVSAFSEDYNLLLIDMIGHGASPFNKPEITLGDMPDITVGILKELGVSSCHVLGVSLGSLVAQGLADQYAYIVKSVTIVGGYSIHDDNKELKRSQGKEMLKWVFYIIFNFKKFKHYIANVSAHSTEGKRLMYLGSSTFKRSGFRALGGMNTIFRQTDESIKYPCLSVVGEHDLPLAHEASKVFVNYPLGRVAIIKDAGHCANADQPQTFNAEYLSFINAIDA